MRRRAIWCGLKGSLRQTSICALIYELTDSLESGEIGPAGSTPPDEIREKIEQITHYLGMELPLHIADEELDILPNLKARSLPEDELDGILERLGQEHEIDEKLSDELNRALASALQKLASRRGLTDIAGRFAEAHCKHMKWENAVLLPLARKRLTPEDLKRIGQNMARRRDVPYPG